MDSNVTSEMEIKLLKSYMDLFLKYSKPYFWEQMILSFNLLKEVEIRRICKQYNTRT